MTGQIVIRYGKQKGDRHLTEDMKGGNYDEKNISNYDSDGTIDIIDSMW